MKLSTIIHDSFEVSIFIKGFDGLLQIIGAGAILFIRPEILSRWVYWLAEKEFVFDSDWTTRKLVEFASNYTAHAQVFAAIYLASHGIIKIFLVFCLWKRKLWAYPTAIMVFILFGVYQIYRYQFTHSVGLVVLTVLDAIVIVLTYLEYKQLKLKFNIN
jgi:uncharacterized membrane protein